MSGGEGKGKSESLEAQLKESQKIRESLELEIQTLKIELKNSYASLEKQLKENSTITEKIRREESEESKKFKGLETKLGIKEENLTIYKICTVYFTTILFNSSRYFHCFKRFIIPIFHEYCEQRLKKTLQS